MVSLTRVRVLGWFPSQLAYLLAALSLFVGCRATGPGQIRLVEDNPQMTERLSRLVPEGMPIEEARATLERNGFICRDEQFAGIQFLECEQQKQKRVAPAMRGVWSAIVYHQNGAVQLVHGRYELVPTDVGVRPGGAIVNGRPVTRHAQRHAKRHKHGHHAH